MNLKSLINDWRASESHERRLCADELEKALKAQEMDFSQPRVDLTYEIGDPLPYMLREQADDGLYNHFNVADGEITDLYGSVYDVVKTEELTDEQRKNAVLSEHSPEFSFVKTQNLSVEFFGAKADD